MSGLPILLWCGASAPVVQGFFTGVGVAAVGLIVFPFGFRIDRPAAGPQTDYAEAEGAVRWSKRVAWLLAVLTALTIGGYIVIYVGAAGKYCDARLPPAIEDLVVPWSVTSVVTVILLVLSMWLRRLAKSGR
jgi:hypothetical protein